MKIFGLVVASLAGVILVIVAVGYTLPVAHTASRTTTFSATPQAVFAAIATPSRFPEWRSGVDTVEILADQAGLPRFRETGDDGSITYVIEERRPDTRLVTRIADKSLPFGGSWTYALTPEDTGTRLRITERGEVYNPVLRVVSRYVFGHHRTIDNYLADLERRLTTQPDTGAQR